MHQLSIMKRRATAMLAAVTVVFLVVTVWGGDSTLAGYVQATAEASMVGGLADWFAVTALFRHPLGIPIPHTAIIVERKQQFGETLGEFIQQTFLTREVVIERMRSAGVVKRGADWLCKPANGDRLARHVLDGAVAIADLVRDEDVHAAVDGVIRTRIEATPLAPLAGRALRFATQTAATTRSSTPPCVDSTSTWTSTATSSARDSRNRRRGGCPVRSRIAFSSACSTARGRWSTRWPMTANHQLRQQLDERLAQAGGRAGDVTRAPRSRRTDQAATCSRNRSFVRGRRHCGPT